MEADDWSDKEELARVWESSIVVIPLSNDQFLEITIGNLDPAEIQNKKFPVVVLLHGCAGVWKGTYRRMDLFARNGFAVITPVSFARKKYPKSCDVKSNTGGLYRAIVNLRKKDVGYTIQKASKLAWVDSDNIFLIGHSEGAIVAATFSDPDTSINARVVESWICSATWNEYGGINAPADEPVLTLLAENDPWFRNPWSAGNCGKYLNTTNGSKSVVFTQPDIRDRHELLEMQVVQRIVLDFLKQRSK